VQISKGLKALVFTTLVTGCSINIPTVETIAIERLSDESMVEESETITPSSRPSEENISTPNKTEEQLETETSSIPEQVGRKVSFQGVVFGDNFEKVKQKLKKFEFVRQEKDFLLFKGRIGTDSATIMAIFTPESKRLWKIACLIDAPKGFVNLKSKWEEYCQVLTEKYGNPDKKLEIFLSPYYEGDGYEETAIAVDKAFFGSLWNLDDGLIGCRISSTKIILVEYENEKFSALNQDEKKSAVRNDL